MGRARCRWAVTVVAVMWAGADPAWAQLWKSFVPVARAEADADASGDLMLSEENGPWHVMAATFSGGGAEQQARELAREFRQRYHLKAYLHEMSFAFADQSAGKGLDQYGGPVRRRYQRDGVREYAVLVGDLASVDDPEAQQLLTRVKTMQPDALNTEGGRKTTQTMARVRQLEDELLAKLGKERKRGPMAQAFLARNPLLPREFFVPQGVDPFVAKMNDGVEHSLLECPGRYTVQVATFRGKSVLQASAEEKGKSSGVGWAWGRKVENPLVEAAENAHLLTQTLRAHGWEAYEFHNRAESVVTIGSFDQVAQAAYGRAGGGAPTPQVQRIIQTFGAMYDTPADPLTGIGNDQGTRRLVDERERQIAQSFSSQLGKIAPGMHPKHVKVFKGRRLDRVIPMDVNPHTIEVPRHSVSGAYAR